MILALDLGSTSFKAGVFDRRLRLLEERSAPLRYRYGPGGRVELDVAWVEAAMRRVLVPRDSISVIALTSQAQTFTVVDPHGRCRRPFVSWQDGSAGAAVARLRRRLPDFASHSSFADLLPCLQICQIKHRPVLQQEMVLSLPSFWVRRWTGEDVTDDNIAAMSGLYSLVHGSWWPAALRACGLRESQLPRVVPIGSVAGVTTGHESGLPAGIPVILAGNDQTAGAYGAQLHKNGATLVTLGTAQVVYRCLERRPAARPGLIRGPYPGGRYYSMAADAWGGNLVNWAETVLVGCATHAQFFAQAARAPAGCRGLTFDPERGAWEGLNLQHEASDMARSILESLADRLSGLLRRVGSRPQRPLLVSGGGAGQPVWRGIVAERLQQRVRTTRANSLLGAARLAADFLGIS
ncbi:MAG: hypothetical protein HXY20_03705 [Acidobacteria bacterium]|nr:hypothetical protein [Acidobacteriota bacterium]